jgi:hypothetical protein
MLTTNIMNVLHKYTLSDEVITSCRDNCNTEFEQAANRGTNNIFAKLKKSNYKIKTRGIGCGSHILHNALQTRADILPIDVEAIVNKLSQNFYIYTVQVKELKGFCGFVDDEYKQILGSVKTWWLSLQPPITRVLSMFL